MLATLQFLIKFILDLSMKLGIVFMIACTVFVIVAFIRGDIKINLLRNKTEEKEWLTNVEIYSGE